ncbi:hypothetical protein ES702_07814 [subsurface metagenome]
MKSFRVSTITSPSKSRVCCDTSCHWQSFRINCIDAGQTRSFWVTSSSGRPEKIFLPLCTLQQHNSRWCKVWSLDSYSEFAGPCQHAARSNKEDGSGQPLLRTLGISLDWTIDSMLMDILSDEKPVDKINFFCGSPPPAASPTTSRALLRLHDGDLSLPNLINLCVPSDTGKDRPS